MFSVKHRVAVVASVAILSWASAAGVAQANPSAPPGPPVAIQTKHSEYRPSLSLPTIAAGLTSTTAGQCALPLSSRKGGWVCPLPGAKTTALRHPSSLRHPAAAQNQEYCNSSGCYYEYDDFHVDFQSDPLVFGYSNDVITDGDAYVNWQLDGARTTSNPARIRTNAVVQDVIFSGDLQNGAVGVNNGGDVVSNASPVVLNGPFTPDTYISWPNGGYVNYDSHNDDHNTAVEASINFPNEPGTWYYYVRSPVSHTTDHEIWRFQGPDQLPGGNTAGLGWNPPGT